MFKARVHGGLDSRLFHFRDAQGPEVDLVVETGSRVILGEVKAGATVNQDYFKGLRRLHDILEDGADHREILSRLIYGGDTRQSRSGADVVPWHEIADVDWV